MSDVPILGDDSPMLFGKFKGMPMQKVPASYLHWLWLSMDGKQRDESPVGKYIRSRIPALQKEKPDLIW